MYKQHVIFPCCTSNYEPTSSDPIAFNTLIPYCQYPTFNQPTTDDVASRKILAGTNDVVPCEILFPQIPPNPNELTSSNGWNLDVLDKYGTMWNPLTFNSPPSICVNTLNEHELDASDPYGYLQDPFYNDLVGLYFSVSSAGSLSKSSKSDSVATYIVSLVYFI